MSKYHDQIRAAVEAAAPYSATRFWWFGVLSGDVAEHLRPLLAVRPDAARGHLVGSLANRLYEDFYQRGGARPTRPPYAGSLRANEWAPFVEEFSAANCGAGTRQAGWVVVGVEGEELSIRREGLTLRAKPDEVVHSGPVPPGVGAEVELRLPKELPAISPGFYTALSDEAYRPEGRQVVRLYWNLYPWGAAPLVRAVSSRLNRARLPFRLKLVNHPDRYTRCDAAVLYLVKEDLAAAIPLLEEVYADIEPDLKRPVPALTKQVAPGIGLAEDPPDGDSFGLHRCRLLADGLARAWERGAVTVEERLAVVVERFSEAGIDIERPWLNPGAADDYDVAFVARQAGTRMPRGCPVARTGDRGFSGRCLQVAQQIGEEICREAFWHKGWCNWLGVEARDPNAPAHQGMTYSSLGPEPYGGSSGVALFLAELAVATGDEDARHTALGAIRQALGRAEAITPPVHLGLYTGLPGLALVAARVGVLLDAEDVVAGARGLLRSMAESSIRSSKPCVRPPTSVHHSRPSTGAEQGEHEVRPYGGMLADDHEWDLLSGAAGGIVALLRIGELIGDDLLVPAVALGERLLDGAEPDGDGCSWPSLALPDAPNLTGLSHGAAGIGMALLEIWRATGDASYRETAERAFAFERGWFNQERGNWPDFRRVTWRDERPDGPFPYPAYWCHGAPGIALSRLRAWELTGERLYRDESIIALGTTGRAVREALEDGTANFSLCHGLAGNAEMLTLGSEALGAGFERFAGLAREVALAGIDLYAPEGRDWPSGAHGGWTPGLMLGLAGVGRFYLCLSDPGLPSILLWRSAAPGPNS